MFAGTILGVFNKNPSEWNKQIAKTDFEVEKIEKLIEERAILKSKRDFEGADAIRDSLSANGIELVDTEDGTSWKSKK